MKTLIIILFFAFTYIIVFAQNESDTSMVFVEGDTFQMGSNDGDSDEKPIQEVAVSSFYISRHEVTHE